MIVEITLDTLPKLQEMGRAFAKEANYPGGFNWPVFSGAWASLITSGVGKIIAVEEGEKLVAALGMAFVPDTFSGVLTAVEQFWFVLPSHRKTFVGLNLFHAFEKEAKIRGVGKLVMVHLAELTPKSLQEFYEKQGYRLVEQTFWKVIE